mmetsp:Transcript_27150/g.49019  ORF Transcript_27150/g.49019 Transcript_27150/m.49019 type:complete len:152 (-) Transcript_27150:2127-2582(-)
MSGKPSPFNESQLADLCKDSNAQYAIFWVKEGNDFKCSQQYLPEGSPAAGYVSESAKLLLSATTAVGRVAESGQQELVTNLNAFYRGELAKSHGIKSVACLMFEDGVLEVGSTEEWTDVPTAAAAATATKSKWMFSPPRFMGANLTLMAGS